MSTLKLRERLRGRRIAREAWIKSQGSIEDAEMIFRGEAKAQGLDPATIMLLIQMALMLWKWWKENNVSEPPEQVQPGEPIDA